MSRLFIFGYGYSAAAFAQVMRAKGWQVTGTTRNAARTNGIAADGVTPLVWPGPGLEAALAGSTHLLISAGPDAMGDPVLRQAQAALREGAPAIAWAGYLSTTGVYGDHQGGWVDERTPLTPGTERGKWRAEAEAAWRAFSAETGMPLAIFRLAGIYGPWRGPFAKVRSGTARRIVKPGQVFSRIHVADIASALALSVARSDQDAVYNLCDDDPAPPEAVIEHAAKLLGLPPPPAEDFATAKMTAMARSFYAESKRVRNDRAKRDLGWNPRYPDFRSGLAALLQGETGGE